MYICSKIEQVCEVVWKLLRNIHVQVCLVGIYMFMNINKSEINNKNQTRVFLYKRNLGVSIIFLFDLGIFVIKRWGKYGFEDDQFLSTVRS